MCRMKDRMGILYRVSWLGAALLTIAAAIDAQSTTPQIFSVLNDASQTADFSPGVRVIILGSNFGPTRNPSDGPFSGLSVSVNQEAVEFLASDNTFIRARFPIDLAANSTVNLVVEYQGVSSTAFIVTINAFSPELYPPSYLQFNNFTNPQQFNTASPGNLIGLLAVGLGPTNPPSPLGSSFSVGQGPPTVSAPTVTLNNQNVPVISSTYFSAGIYSVLVRVPQDLAEGDYPLSLSIQGSSSNVVPLSVRPFGIVPTQTGFTYQAAQGGGAPSPASFQVLNATATNLTLGITTSTVTGGNWLSVSSTQVPVTAGEASSPIAVSANPAGLAPGDYYGQIQVSAPGAPNTPQVLSAVLNVSGANTVLAPNVNPTGLVFVTVIGSPLPAAQSVAITNLGQTNASFSATVSFPSGTTAWVAPSPASGSVIPGQPFDVQLTPLMVELAAGVYPGTLLLQFPATNTTLAVGLALIVTTVLNPAARSDVQEHPGASGSCTPTKLVAVFSLLGNGFSTPAAWPTPIAAQVYDDCGSPLIAGTVTATFSNGDPALSLVPSLNGLWSATWVSSHPGASNVVVTVSASEVSPKLSGSAQVTGAVQANPNVPVLNAGGVVSAASFSGNFMPSPGEMVSIFGASLANGTSASPALPLSVSLNGASLVLAGVPVPLLFVSGSQINAVLPYTVTPNTTFQLIEQNGNRLSVPIPISFAAADPAIFTTDQSGGGQGEIYVVNAQGEAFLADSSHPAAAGEALTIYASGLGTVTPAIEAGIAAPDSPLSHAAGVGLTIGGQTAQILFAGLAPGFAGLYQVNAVVPKGVASGTTPVLLSVAGIAGPPVTMVVQ
jgi:uncharacterized protein (TIGR03437 family)